jgi:uncharacterized DUF497 family protein
VKFDWNPAKAAANRRKHGVSFEEAEKVFGNLLAITNTDPAHSDDEDRERTIGVSDKDRVLVVITTRRSGIMRIISARKATLGEVQAYEKEIQTRFG